MSRPETNAKYSPPAGSGYELVPRDRLGELTIYDSLPREIREIVASAPVVISMDEIAQWLPVHGTRAICQQLLFGLRDLFPDWQLEAVLTTAAQRPRRRRSG